MGVIYSNEGTGVRLGHKRRLNRWIKECAEAENWVLGDVAIVLCSDSYLLQVNRQYLQHDYLTDIITFPYNQGRVISGDLLISVDTVRSNAQEYGVVFHVELCRVIIHGVLHLMGYKDKTAAESKIMRTKEDQALCKLAEMEAGDQKKDVQKKVPVK